MKVIFVGGAGIQTYENVEDYRVEDYKASTYHVLTFYKGVKIKLNDFGVRTVTVVPDGVSARDLPSIV